MQNNTFSTLFIGQNYIKLPRVDSTNSFLKELLSNSEPLAEGTVIMAEEQFSGRGQFNSVWQSAPGKNLTFSIYLKPSFLPVDKQFYLNICICLGITNALNTLFNMNLKVKWPNDIYFENKKLGGILIENIVSGTGLKHSIVGIGLNINQEAFEDNLESKAISLQQILHQDVHLLSILTEICKHIEGAYLQLRSKNFNSLTEAYINNLYRFNVKSWFRQNGEVFEGTIEGVSENGQLLVNLGNDIVSYNFKEIEYIIP